MIFSDRFFLFDFFGPKKSLIAIFYSYKTKLVGYVNVGTMKK